MFVGRSKEADIEPARKTRRQARQIIKRRGQVLFTTGHRFPCLLRDVDLVCAVPARAISSTFRDKEEKGQELRVLNSAYCVGIERLVSGRAAFLKGTGNRHNGDSSLSRTRVHR